MFANHYDLHVHSSYSDGSDDINDIVQRANMLHLEAIAITDHFWPSMGAQRGGKSIIDKRRQEIDTARVDYPKLNILDGAEVDIQSNGDLAPVAGGLEQFDIVIGSFHWVSDSRTWSVALTKAIENPKFQILGHWDGYLSSYREKDGRAVIEALAGTGIAIELNGRYLSEQTEFLEMARDNGCIFSFGSDSHSMETIGQLDFQRKLAEDLDLDLVEPNALLALKSSKENK
jgi:histidinol phosphatase-like PHP family hydrolase